MEELSKIPHNVFSNFKGTVSLSLQGDSTRVLKTGLPIICLIYFIAFFAHLYQGCQSFWNRLCPEAYSTCVHVAYASGHVINTCTLCSQSFFLGSCQGPGHFDMNVFHIFSASALPTIGFYSCSLILFSKQIQTVILLNNNVANYQD